MEWRMRPDDAIPPLYGTYAPPTFRGAVTETVATLREVVLMARDIPAVVPGQMAPHTDVVVLVHGFFASAGVFRPMRRHLVAHTGANVASFTHAPGVGIERIARSLARIVDRIPRDCRVHLIGHSLGGLIARWYVQELGGHTRVTQTISLGSPFGGTERAWRLRFLVGADLHRRSPLLARLRARAHEHEVDHTSVVADADAMIIPGESAVFPRGDVVVLAGRGHNSLLFDPESITHVVDRVKRAQKRST
jgi:triacylglycerol lipase